MDPGLSYLCFLHHRLSTHLQISDSPKGGEFYLQANYENDNI